MSLVLVLPCAGS